MIDASTKCKTNSDYLISVADVQAWEKENGDEAITKLYFPSIDPELALWPLKNRKIKAVHIDTASVDYGQFKDFKTHQNLQAEDIIGFENIANIDTLPVKGFFVIALPMKIKDGTCEPLRIIACMRDAMNPK